MVCEVASQRNSRTELLRRAKASNHSPIANRHLSKPNPNAGDQLYSSMRTSGSVLFYVLKLGRGNVVPRKLQISTNQPTVIDFGDEKAGVTRPHVDIALLEGESGVFEYPLRAVVVRVYVIFRFSSCIRIFSLPPSLSGHICINILDRMSPWLMIYREYII